MPGPAPKPTALKKLAGTHRPSRDAPNQMSLPKLHTIQTPPDDLPEIGKKEWYSVVNQLVPLGALSGADLSLLKSYCQHVATMEIAAQHLARNGYTTMMQNKGGGSYEIKSPWVTIYNEASDRAAKLGQQFGLTPSSRTRISAPAPNKEEQDPWQTM